jgi:NAD(P)-dependent dehydrogenase (short-subunit alcohol dehydrogenase family)
MNAPMPAFDLSGQTILVAGGAGYLALPLCRLIVAAGGNLCIGDFNAARLREALDTLKTEHPRADILGLPLDVGEEASILDFTARAAENFGPLHGLVNATYGGTAKRLDDLTGDDFDRASHLNLTGSFLLARAVARQMTQGGSIVMYASMYGVVAPVPGNYPGDMNVNPIEYGAGKAGMIQMVRYLAAHYGRQNIRVNAIAPGPFPNRAAANLPDEFIANLDRSTMLGRVGDAHETAGPALFLLSNAASYVSGHVLNVDGGWTAW